MATWAVELPAITCWEEKSARPSNPDRCLKACVLPIGHHLGADGVTSGDDIERPSADLRGDLVLVDAGFAAPTALWALSGRERARGDRRGFIKSLWRCACPVTARRLCDTVLCLASCGLVIKAPNQQPVLAGPAAPELGRLRQLQRRQGRGLIVTSPDVRKRGCDSAHPRGKFPLLAFDRRRHKRGRAEEPIAGHAYTDPADVASVD